MCRVLRASRSGYYDWLCRESMDVGRRLQLEAVSLFYSREGRESQDAALLMSVVGQFVASSWAAHGCRGVLQVLSRGGFPFPEGYTAA